MNTADLLLSNLERLLSSPTSAETIRKLIFDLAIRGQLSIQSHKDEPASALIAKVIRTAQAEDRKFSAEPAVTEKPFEVPSGWEWVRLGNTGKIFNGTSTSAGEKVRLSKTTDGLPFIATKDVGYGREPLCYENGLKVPHGDKDYKVAKSGAVLICAEGGSAGKKVGQTNRPICFGNKLYANETWAGIEPGYILSLYQSNFFYGEFKAKMAGIIGGIARSDFRSLRIPLPPLAEQKRIVAKVDELMVLCDRLEAQLKERDVMQAALAKAALAKFTEDPTPENLQLLFHPSFSIEPKDLRQAIVTLAVQGKIQGPDSETNSAEEIIGRIDRLRPTENPAEVTQNERPWLIPKTWAWVRLERVMNVKHGYAFSSDSFTSKPSPYVLTTPGNFYESGGFRHRGENTKYFKGEVPPSFILKAGDLIIPMTEQAAGLLGSPAFIPDDGEKYLHNQRLGKLELFSPEIVPAYVFWFFNSTFLRKELARTCTGMKVRHTSPKRILSVPFPLPPTSEQRFIATRVEELMKLIDQMEAQLEASRTTGEKLLEAMVAELTAA